MPTYWNRITGNPEVWASSPGAHYSTTTETNKTATLRNVVQSMMQKPTQTSRIINMTTVASVGNQTSTYQYRLYSREEGGTRYLGLACKTTSTTTYQMEISVPAGLDWEIATAIENQLLSIFQGFLDEKWPPITNPCTKNPNKNCDAPPECCWRMPSGNTEVWCENPGGGKSLAEIAAEAEAKSNLKAAYNALALKGTAGFLLSTLSQGASPLNNYLGIRTDLPRSKALTYPVGSFWLYYVQGNAIGWIIGHTQLQDGSDYELWHSYNYISSLNCLLAMDETDTFIRNYVLPYTGSWNDILD